MQCQDRQSNPNILPFHSLYMNNFEVLSISILDGSSRSATSPLHHSPHLALDPYHRSLARI